MLPLDFDKSISGNTVTASIELTPLRRQNSLFVLPNVFFFGSTLSISYIDIDGTTVTLRPGIDFEPYAVLDNISSAVDNDAIYGSIRLINTGINYVTLSCTAHMMGGSWSADEVEFTSMSRTGYNASTYHPACRITNPININIGGVVHACDIGTRANIKLLQDGTWGVIQVSPCVNENTVAPTATSDTVVDINGVADSAVAKFASALLKPVQDFSAASLASLKSMLSTIFDVKTSASIGTGLEDDATSNGGSLIARVGRIRAYIADIDTLVTGFFTDFRKTPAMAQLPTKPIIGYAQLAANVLTLPDVGLTNGIPIIAADTNAGTIYAIATSDIPAGGYSAFLTALGSGIPAYAYPLAPGESMVVVSNNLKNLTLYGTTGDAVKWTGGY